MGSMLQDDFGNWSSMRLFLFLAFGLMCWMFWEWRTVLHYELSTGAPDYDNLIKLFLAMLVTFALAFIGKIIQKTME